MAKTGICINRISANCQSCKTGICHNGTCPNRVTPLVRLGLIPLGHIPSPRSDLKNVTFACPPSHSLYALLSQSVRPFCPAQLVLLGKRAESADFSESRNSMRCVGGFWCKKFVFHCNFDLTRRGSLRNGRTRRRSH